MSSLPPPLIPAHSLPLIQPFPFVPQVPNFNSPQFKLDNLLRPQLAISNPAVPRLPFVASQSDMSPTTGGANLFLQSRIRPIQNHAAAYSNLVQFYASLYANCLNNSPSQTRSEELNALNQNVEKDEDQSEASEYELRCTQAK